MKTQFLILIICLFSSVVSAQRSGCITGDCDNGYGTYVFGSDTKWAGDKYTGTWQEGMRNGTGTYTYSSGAKYVGEFLSNKFHGKGTFYYANGDKYEGEWDNDLKHGQGVYVWSDGEKYDGQWTDGKRTGYGAYYWASGKVDKGYFKEGTYIGTSNNSNTNNSGRGNLANNLINDNGSTNTNANTETGCVEGNCTDGYGVYKWKSGEKYAGNWATDKRNGQGTNYYSNGDNFNGNWKDDLQHGYGTYMWANGDKFSGNYTDHKRTGYGTYWFKDGRKYEGNWLADKYDGQGTFYYTDGTVQSGTWVAGVFQGSNSKTYSGTGCVSGDCSEGYGVYQWESGEKYEGYWSEGMRNGQGTNNFASGAKYVGAWKNDKKHGIGTYTYKSSSSYKSYMGSFSEDKMHGQGTLLYKDGKKFVGQLKEDKYDGEGTLYNADGTVQEAGIYKDDVYIGKSEANFGCTSGDCQNGTGTYSFSSGDKYVGQFKNGTYNGKGTFYFENGDKYIGDWKNGKFEGTGTYTFSVDQRKYVGQWKDGKYNGEGTMFYSNGTTEAGLWENGTYKGKIQNNTAKAPVITWSFPEYYTTTTTSEEYAIKACVDTDTDIKETKIYINDVLQTNTAVRGFSVVTTACNNAVEQTLKLKQGVNKIKIVCTNQTGSTTSEIRSVTLEKSSQEKRLALVIGNASYSTSPLRNPVNDAKAMGEELKKLGFEVMMYTDIGQNDMKKAIRAWGEKLAAQKGVGLFFFAGHGIQMSGENFIVPVDAQIEKEQDVELEAVNLQRVMGEMDYAHSDINIVILDACRNNPFARSFRSGGSNGLATTTAPQGTFIAYATAPGSVAQDGSGVNGLYTQEFLKAVRTPGLKIEDVFKKVRMSVYEQSGKQQVPWENSSIFGDFYFQK